MEARKEVPIEDAVKLGLRAYQENNTLVAAQVFRDILNASPGHYISLYFLGLCEYHNGNVESARDYLEKAIEVDATDAQLWSNLGAMHYKLGDNKKALELWNKSLELNPELPDAYGNKANALWEIGDAVEAEKYARRAVELCYEYPDAWLNLGNALVSQKRFDEAFEAWNEALKINPRYAAAFNNMGNALREQGKLKESEEHCRKALAYDPNYPHAHNNLANALRDQGHPVEAEKHYRKAIELQPSYAEAQNNLCVCLIDQGRYEEATLAARYAVSFKPDYADAYLNLCMAMRLLGKTHEAEHAAQKALKLKPDSAMAHIELADIRYMQDRYGDAEELIRQAQKLEPDSTRLNLKLAQVLERAQRVEEALEAVYKAVEENPEMAEAYLVQAQICHISNRLDEALAAAKKCAELSPETAVPYILLAEIWLTKGDLKKAEDYARKAQGINDMLPGIYSTLGKIKKYTKEDEDYKNLMKIARDHKKRGLSQSSTLNFALFDAYEDVGDYKKAFAHLMEGNKNRRDLVPYDRKLQEQMYANIKKQYTPEFIKSCEGKGFDSDLPVFILGMPRSGTTLTEQIISSHPDVYGAGELYDLPMVEREIGTTEPANAAEIGKAYVEAIRKRDKTGKMKRITDKMPGNYLRIGQIASVLPNARIIHCRRDPVDTCLSCFKQNFARGQYWSYDLEDLAHQYKLYLDLMEYWRGVLGDRFLEIQYEETVTDFENQARKLIDYIGLPWNDACLAPHKQKRDVLTASKTQVIQPVYTSSVKSWKRYEKQLEPLMELLGYDKKTGTIKA